MQIDNLQPAHCRVAGCIAVANRKGAGLCEKHYTRYRRHGSTDKAAVIKPGLLNHSHGYTLAYAPEHPLRRDSSCRVYEHRRVYHAQHGDGPFNCYWCSTVVGWDDLHVDHLNDVKNDNIPSNLVASCASCNQKRGFSKMARTQRLRSNRRYTVHGKTMCLIEWARYLNLSRNALEYRLSAGWKHEDVFSPRKGRSGPPSRAQPVATA